MTVDRDMTKRSSLRRTTGGGRSGKKKRRFRLECGLGCLVVAMGMLILYVNTLLLNPMDESVRNPRPRGGAPRNNSNASTPGGQAGGTTTKNIDPFLKILRHAGVDDTPELRSQLPDWQDVLDRFGDKPVIVGLERCQEFNARVPLAKRWLAAAGTFNSGTNFLFDMLEQNCRVPRPRKYVKGGRQAL
jgi:hypothetical protein